MTKKRKIGIAVLTMAAAGMLFGMVACSEAENLNRPQALHIENEILYWDEVENAEMKIWSTPGYLNIVAENASAQIYSTSGSLVWEGKIYNERNLNLNKGIYIVKVHNAKSTICQKVVVE